MNTEQPTPAPVPMVKEQTVKDDGRFLIYYSFPNVTAPAHGTSQERKTTEDTDV